ncbi:MAG: 30S ribosomal protein S9 [Candidatus Peregrinibacteria bacterium]|nr:30S ribosomal protein S9 [Candidatus Peregrinibacteria bacterium]
MATKRTTKVATPTEEKEVKEVKPTLAATPKGKYYYACGKRKTSIAKVQMFKGSGEITINGRAVNEYLPVKTLVGTLKTPLTITGSVKSFDIVAKVQGGGISSQAEAIRHGIAKALLIYDPLNKAALKKAGLLTRDSRIKERKKFGLKRARKGPQFSKR